MASPAPQVAYEQRPVSGLRGEVFGPVLHVLRYRREDMETVVRAVNATGFGLTFGVQSRIDETIERALELMAAFLSAARDLEDEGADKVVLTMFAHPPASQD